MPLHLKSSNSENLQSLSAGHFSDAEEDEQDDDDDEGDDGEGGADADDDETSPSGPERAFSLCKPLAARQIAGFESSADRHIYYGNDTYYVLFRLHQILYERVSAAKHAAKEAEEKWRQSKDSAPPDLYAKYVGRSLRCQSLDAEVDSETSNFTPGRQLRGTRSDLGLKDGSHCWAVETV